MQYVTRNICQYVVFSVSFRFFGIKAAPSTILKHKLTEDEGFSKFGRLDVRGPGKRKKLQIMSDAGQMEATASTPIVVCLMLVRCGWQSAIMCDLIGGHLKS